MPVNALVMLPTQVWHRGRSEQRGRHRRRDHQRKHADGAHPLTISLGWQHGTMPISTGSVSHVRLTVTDIGRSREFYESVFSWPIAIEVPPNADAQTEAALGFLFGGVIYNIGHALIGLRPVAEGSFDENRVGLDHLAFKVAGKDEIDEAATHLDDLGISHEPVKDIGQMYILEFRDPDGIALELAAPK